jgi:hypothetical protein
MCKVASGGFSIKDIEAKLMTEASREVLELPSLDVDNAKLA